MPVTSVSHLSTKTLACGENSKCIHFKTYYTYKTWSVLHRRIT